MSTRRCRPSFCAALVLALFGHATTGCELIVEEVREHLPSGNGGGVVLPQPAPPPSAFPRTCFGAGTASSPGAPANCRPASDWKKEAYGSCSGSMAELVKFELTQPCGGDLYGGMHYECCTSGKPVDPTPPSPDPSTCIVGELDDGPVCAPADELKQRAGRVCEAKGLELTDFGVGGPCADGMSVVGAKYRCCPQKPTPPNPAPVPPQPATPARECRKLTEGGDSSCKDTATWKSIASEACAQSSMSLVEMHPRMECGKDLFRFVDYACCRL